MHINKGVKMQGWIYLGLGILFEVMGTWAMKLSQGFTKPVASITFVSLFATALVFINLSMKTIDMSVAYAVWCGAGIFLISTIGYLFLGESMTPWKLACLALIIVGVVGLYGFDR
jgi:small multidrug resistance pump